MQRTQIELSAEGVFSLLGDIKGQYAQLLIPGIELPINTNYPLCMKASVIHDIEIETPR